MDFRNLNLFSLSNSPHFSQKKITGNKIWDCYVESPGRINLIGEHTDYNFGFVLPTAIDKKTFLKLRKNGDPKNCTVYSKTLNSQFTFNLNDYSKSKNSWQNYILGVVNELHKMGLSLEGFDCVINSEIPVGAGMSSSAALQCGLASGLNQLFDLNVSQMQIIKLSQAAENQFVGSQCGIMDQFASVLSKSGNLILLDCLTLKAQYIPADFKCCKILLVNTNVSHSIAEGEYNTRRKECESALEIFQKYNPEVKSLRDVDEELLLYSKKHLNTQQYNRVLYVLQENRRVLKSPNLLKEGNLKEFGQLMYESHAGLSQLYEVSCKELDFLVKYTENKDFIYGARMMGGGFGGCTINIIEENRIVQFEKEIFKDYKDQFGISPSFISVFPGEGTVIKDLR